MHTFLEYGFKGIDLAQNFFFDANIWITTNGPVPKPNERKTIIYSSMIKNIRATGGKIFSDTTIISEFINRYARLEFQVASKTGFNGDFKGFRCSAGWQPVAKDIRDEVAAILSLSEFISDSRATKTSIAAICNRMVAGNADFNDEIILDICRSEEFCIVTHDADFLGVMDCNVYSCNPAYRV